MNPGDLMLYWRSDVTRSLAMEGAVKRVSIWPQSFDSKHGETRVTLYGGFLEFEAPETGDLNTYDAEGKPSDSVSVIPSDHLPDEKQFPVTAIFRFPAGSHWDHLPPFRVECQLVLDPVFTLRFLPGAVMTITK